MQNELDLYVRVLTNNFANKGKNKGNFLRSCINTAIMDVKIPFSITIYGG